MSASPADATRRARGSRPWEGPACFSEGEERQHDTSKRGKNRQSLKMLLTVPDRQTGLDKRERQQPVSRVSTAEKESHQFPGQPREADSHTSSQPYTQRSQQNNHVDLNTSNYEKTKEHNIQKAPQAGCLTHWHHPAARDVTVRPADSPRVPQSCPYLGGSSDEQVCHWTLLCSYSKK